MAFFGGQFKSAQGGQFDRILHFYYTFDNNFWYTDQLITG